METTESYGLQGNGVRAMGAMGAWGLGAGLV